MARCQIIGGIIIMSKYNIEEVKNYCFFMIPQSLITNKKYSKLNANAKILYSVLFNRMQLSIKNNFTDENGDIYIIFSREEMAETMNVSLRSIINYMNELKEYGLVEEKRRGLGLKNLIFLQKPEGVKTYKKINASQEVKKDTTHYNNTYCSNTNNNNNNTDTDAKEDIEVDEVSNTDFVVDDSTSKQEDVERLFNLAKKVSSAIGIPLLQKLLKRYSYKEIEDKLLYMQKFQERNTIYNPCGFLVQSLRDNYTFIDKAKVILEKANKAIAKSYQELEEYRKIKTASKQVSLGWLKSMKLQLQGAV